MQNESILWYKQPAEFSRWTQALPVGSGRLGAMVFGGIQRETLSLNEDSLWSGYPRDTNLPGSAAYFRKSQDMIRAKQYAQTQRLIEENVLALSRSLICRCAIL